MWFSLRRRIKRRGHDMTARLDEPAVRRRVRDVGPNARQSLPCVFILRCVRSHLTSPMRKGVFHHRRASPGINLLQMARQLRLAYNWQRSRRTWQETDTLHPEPPIPQGRVLRLVECPSTLPRPPQYEHRLEMDRPDLPAGTFASASSKDSSTVGTSCRSVIYTVTVG
jgi:hypothetical protein